MLSLRSRIYRYFLARSNLFSRDVPELRRELLAAGARAKIRPGVTSEQIAIGDVPTVRLVPKDARDGIAMVYLHGGGGCLGLFPTTVAFVSRLAEAARLEVLIPDYRVAPEHPYPAAHDDARVVCGDLASGGRRLILAGDSFGFGLGLAALLELPPTQRAAFRRAIGFTPLVDLSGTSQTLRSHQSVDPFRLADPLRLPHIYARGADLSSPRLSPLWGALDRLPPLFLQAAGRDVFLGDATRLAERARQANVPVDLRVWEGMWHVFQLAAGSVPESNRALREAASVMAE